MLSQHMRNRYELSVQVTCRTTLPAVLNLARDVRETRIVIGCWQENSEFPVTEYYGAQTSTTTNKIKTSFYEKVGGREAMEKFVHDG